MVNSYEKLSDKQELINKIIESIDLKVDALLEIPSRYALTGGGKRLRPLICMLCAEMVGGSSVISQDAFIALELIHNGTLIHDDIIDEDLARRGAPTVHVKFGGKRAILTGDVLLSLGLKYATKTGNIEIVRLLSETSLKMVQGVALQTFYRRKLIPESKYIEIMYLKSGSLFEAAAVIGGLSASGDEEILNRFSDFGSNFGIAYQIRDDLQDAMTNAGKEGGSDILNGDPALPFIYAVESERIGEEDRDYLLNVFNGRVEKADYERVRRIFKETGVIDRTINKMKDYAELSKKSLEYFPSSEAKKHLNLLLDLFYRDLNHSSPSLLS
ncbi:MAG: polyprenyl synthetase family protein [Candidatus Bathyarchaeia archaeon]